MSGLPPSAAFATAPLDPEPLRDEVDRWPGLVLIEFGAGWCGICRAAQPAIRQVVQQQPALTHVKIEDGKGRRLGRSFGIKLWPTLVLLRDGHELARIVRPEAAAEIEAALAPGLGGG